MNVIVNKILLVGDKCMPEMHLRFVWIYIQYLWAIYKKER